MFPRISYFQEFEEPTNGCCLPVPLFLAQVLKRTYCSSSSFIYYNIKHNVKCWSEGIDRQVALMNALPSHGEGLVKTAITCLQEMTKKEDLKVGESEGDICAFLQKLSAFLVVFPGKSSPWSFLCHKFEFWDAAEAVAIFEMLSHGISSCLSLTRKLVFSNIVDQVILSLGRFTLSTVFSIYLMFIPVTYLTSLRVMVWLFEAKYGFLAILPLLNLLIMVVWRVVRFL